VTYIALTHPDSIPYIKDNLTIHKIKIEQQFPVNLFFTDDAGALGNMF